MQIIITDLSGHKMRLLDLSLARIIVLGLLGTGLIATAAIGGYRAPQFLSAKLAANWPRLGRIARCQCAKQPFCAREPRCLGHQSRRNARQDGHAG